MSYLIREASSVLIPSLSTCGGDLGPLFLVAQAIKKTSEGELREIIPKKLTPVAEQSILRLEKEAVGGKILPESVTRRYGLPPHFHEMNSQAQLGMDSVAREIPVDIRPVAHTLLPLRKGVYQNEGVKISFKSLVPLGPQEGILVAHLAGVFSCHCSVEMIEKLLQEQAKDTKFMEMASRVGKLDYGSTQLQRATVRAKEALGL